MRIALICSDSLPVPPVLGGAIPTHVAGIASHLATLAEVTVFSVMAPGLPAEEIQDGVRFVRAPAGAYLDTVVRQVQGGRFDLLHVFNRPAWIPWLAEAAPGARRVLRVHGPAFDPQVLPPGQARACIERVDAIDTVSHFMGRAVSGRYPEAQPKVRTIYTGVDAGRFVPAWHKRGARLRKAMRRELGIDRDVPVVLFAGRVIEAKGPHVLLGAMEAVRRAVPQALLLVVGSDWFGSTTETDYTRALARSAAALGDAVRLTGYLPALEIERAFACADVLVCPSQWEEPLARVLFEAMAAGLPIVTTGRGGNPEVVWDGINGFVVSDYRNPLALARPIAALLQDPALRQRLGARGRLLAEARFSWARAAEETLTLYEQLVGKSGTGHESRPLPGGISVE